MQCYAQLEKYLLTLKKIIKVWKIDVFEWNLKYMGASDVYYKTLKEHHVIIHFANKTEKNYSTFRRGMA